MRIVYFAASLLGCVSLAAGAPFVVRVTDEATGRGVPLAELKTTTAVSYWTDSAGVIALDEPALVGQKVYFHVQSPGYEYPADGFNNRGVALDVRAGATATIKLKRLLAAERMYRVTGPDLYRDSVLAGLAPPIKRPLLNGGVAGQDSVQAAAYDGKIYWFWGDTGRLSYPLGLFRTAGATSERPGGLTPDKGVDLTYFTGNDGFARALVPGDAPGPVWIDGLAVVRDGGRQRGRMVAHASRMKSLGERVERQLVVFDDEKKIFVRLADVPLDAPLAPAGQTFLFRTGDVEHVYFADPYPSVRVVATLKAMSDLSQYEACTPVATGTKFAGIKTKLDRDGAGKVVWSWKPGGTPIRPAEIDELVKAKVLDPADTPFTLRDAADGTPVRVHAASVQWNGHRRRLVMIGEQSMGSSVLGEIWYAESEKPEGPWGPAVKIATHGGMDFYNPAQHAFFAEQDGKIIYFEGTYTNTFSGIKQQTPRYEYNQLMYRLDVDDKRLAAARR